MRLTSFEGDMFWDAADPEMSHNDPEDTLDGLCPGDIVEIQQAKSLPNFFGVDLGEDASGVALYEFFDNEEEALEASLQVRNPICKHENCQHPYGAHANGSIDTPRTDFDTGAEIGRWVWKKLACPIGPDPFHPTQTFKETA